jgi:hypothetical protein
MDPDDFKWKVEAALYGNLINHVSFALFTNGTVVYLSADQIGLDAGALL